MMEIKKATIEDIDTLMSWRMEVLHDVFSIEENLDMSERGQCVSERGA